jgi:hypothetical protein
MLARDRACFFALGLAAAAAGLRTCSCVVAGAFLGRQACKTQWTFCLGPLTRRCSQTSSCQRQFPHFTLGRFKFNLSGDEESNSGSNDRPDALCSIRFVTARGIGPTPRKTRQRQSVKRLIESDRHPHIPQSLSLTWQRESDALRDPSATATPQST